MYKATFCTPRETAFALVSFTKLLWCCVRALCTSILVTASLFAIMFSQQFRRLPTTNQVREALINSTLISGSDIDFHWKEYSGEFVASMKLFTRARDSINRTTQTTGSLAPGVSRAKEEIRRIQLRYERLQALSDIIDTIEPVMTRLCHTHNTEWVFLSYQQRNWYEAAMWGETSVEELRAMMDNAVQSALREVTRLDYLPSRVETEVAKVDLSNLMVDVGSSLERFSSALLQCLYKFDPEVYSPYNSPNSLAKHFRKRIFSKVKNPAGKKRTKRALEVWKNHTVAYNYTNYHRVVRKALDAVIFRLENGMRRSYSSEFTLMSLPVDDRIIYLQGKAVSDKALSRAKGKLKNTTYKDFDSTPIYDIKAIKKAEGNKIRIGFVSPHLHGGNILGKVACGFIAELNRSRFEKFCYRLKKPSPAASDFVYRTVTASGCKYISLHNMTLEQQTSVLLKDKLSVIVDLNMQSGTPMITLAPKPAPIIVGMLGLAATSGASYYDYFIADKIVVPPRAKQYFAETVAYMPNAYHYFEGSYEWRQGNNIAQYPRLEEAKNKGFTKFYCSMVNVLHFESHVFSVWMNVLKRVNDSALVFRRQPKRQPPGAFNQIKVEARKRGVDPSRIIGTGRIGTTRYRGFFSLCYANLDTYFYNGHSTQGDMLYSGVPPVSISSNKMAGRVGESFAKAVGLPPEIHAKTWKEYEDLAVRYAKDSEFYRRIRTHLEKEGRKSTLFDGKRWTRDFENLVEGMHEKAFH